MAQTSFPAAAYGAQALAAVRLEHLPLLVKIFAIGLTIPLILNVGPLRLSVYRIILLILFLPALYRLLSGRVGGVKTPDIAVFVICIWSTIAMLIIEGPLVETIGILIAETLGGYMMGRCYVRTPQAFLQMCKLFTALVMIIFPLAMIESLTGREVILQLFDTVGSVYPAANMEKRMGLYRAQGPFAHPIHFGLFCGAFIGTTYYVVGYGKSVFGQLWRTGVIVVTATLALSSGPLTALTAQLYIVGWDRIFNRIKARWYILGGLVLLAYVTVDLLSNRNPFQVFISYMAFNASTAYNRIWIWVYGTASIFNNPWWGVGIGPNWSRPYWMSASADMFWIVPAMRHGIVVWIAYFTLLLSITVPLMFRKFGPMMNAYRLGFLTTIAGLFMAGWTVHYWDAIFAFLMFMLGSGVWMIDYKEEDETGKEVLERPAKRGRVYSRFPVRSGSNATAGRYTRTRKEG